MSTLRTRWAAIGAAVAVTLGAGGVSLGRAAIGSGDKPVFVAIEPCRLVDTRPGDNNIGSRDTPLGAADTLTLQITGSTGDCTGIPAGATAAAMNVTAIQGSTRSYLTLYPADADLPLASNLNWNGGDPPTPNKVDVALATTGPDTGAVKITNNAGTVHVAADLVGYYTDHHHDDRYYTKAQVDELIEIVYPDDPIVETGIEFEPDSAFDDLTETITTSTAGRLLIDRTARVGATCSTGVSVSTLVMYVTIDGMAVRSTLYRRTFDPADPNPGEQLVAFRGVTDHVVEAGQHEIAVGLECLSPIDGVALISDVIGEQDTNSTYIVLPS